MTSLPGDFRSHEITWRHFLSRDCLLLRATPGRKSNVQYTPVFGLLQPLPGDFRSNDVTSGLVRSRDVISYHVIASSCKLQPCRKSNAQYTPVFGLLTPTSRWLPLKWRPLRVTSGHLRSLDVISCHVTASCKLQPCRKSNKQYTPVFGLLTYFQVTSGQMTSLPADFRWPEVAWHHFLSRECLLLRATAL